MSNFWQRTLTGAVFVLVMVGSIYFGGTFWLFLIITALGLWEFYRIMLGEGNMVARIYGTVIGIAVYISISLVFSRSSGPMPVRIAGGRPDSLAMLLPGFVLVLLIELFRKHPDPIKNISTAVFGWMYVSLPFALGFVLDVYDRGLNSEFFAVPHPLPFLIVIFTLIWCNDTFAYLTGRLVGKTPLFPRISPKKTIEGTLGGALVTMLAAWLLRDYLMFPLNRSLAFILLTGLTVAVMGVLGDLVESKFKRQLGIKDSGNILPGHGGILDRFDSFLLVIPSVYMLIQVAYFFLYRSF